MLADGLRFAASALAAVDVVGVLDVAVVTAVVAATGWGALGRDDDDVSERTEAFVVATGVRPVRVRTDVRAMLAGATARLRRAAAIGVEAPRGIESTCTRRGVCGAFGRVARTEPDRLVSVGPVGGIVAGLALSVAREPVAPDASETA